MAPIVISISALAFTIFSFWWIHWRPGRLVIPRPRAYAAIGYGRGEALGVAVPLVFLNRGASPLVVTNLQLVVSGPGFRKLAFAFNDTASSLAFEATRSMAVPFHVLGNQALALVCEFIRLPGEPTFQIGTYHAELQARLQGSTKWVQMLTFELPVPTEAVKVVAESGYLAVDIDAELAGLPRRALRLRSPLRAA